MRKAYFHLRSPFRQHEAVQPERRNRPIIDFLAIRLGNGGSPRRLSDESPLKE